jgi:hypothetical protein
MLRKTLLDCRANRSRNANSQLACNRGQLFLLNIAQHKLFYVLHRHGSPSFWPHSGATAQTYLEHPCWTRRPLGFKWFAELQEGVNFA